MNASKMPLNAMYVRQLPTFTLNVHDMQTLTFVLIIPQNPQYNVLSLLQLTWKIYVKKWLII